MTPQQKAHKKEWTREYEKTPGQRAHRKAHKCLQRTKALALLGDRCRECGVKLVPGPICADGAAFEPHHLIQRAISGRQKIEWSWSWSKIKAELLDGCVLLCARCHRVTDGHSAEISWEKRRSYAG